VGFDDDVAAGPSPLQRAVHDAHAKPDVEHRAAGRAFGNGCGGADGRSEVHSQRVQQAEVEKARPNELKASQGEHVKWEAMGPCKHPWS
jgi:plastocyanin